MITLFTMINVFVLGLAASFAPCLFPVLPSYIAFLTKSDTKKHSALLTGVLTTLGIMTVFTIFGLIVTRVSVELNDYLSSNYLSFRFYQGLLLIVLGILLMRKTTFGSGKLSSLSTKVQSIINRYENPYIVSYLIGLFFAILAAPCALIAFTSVFTIIATVPGFTNAMILMMIFSLAAGTPFLLMGSLVPTLKESILENSERIFKLMPIIAGIIIVINGAYLVFDAIDLGFQFNI